MITRSDYLTADDVLRVGDEVHPVGVPDRWHHLTPSGFCSAWVGRSVREYARFAGLPEDRAARRSVELRPMTAWDLDGGGA